MRKFIPLCLTVVAVGTMLISTTNLAEAGGRKTCVFQAKNHFTGLVNADGKAKARKMSTACKRARRRCNRERNRKLRRGLSIDKCRRV